MRAIVISGGRGSRLLTYADNTPKALLRFGDHSLLEIVLLRLRQAGFRRVTLCTGHLGDLIRQEFTDGSRLDMAIDYHHETVPLGTAGPLRQVTDWSAPALVMNCDILTTLDLNRLYREHRDSGAVLTVAVRRDEVVVPFGVVETTGDNVVRDIREKPSLGLQVSAGIYVVDPAVRTLIPQGAATDMPTLIGRLLALGHQVRSYPFTETWQDIGTPERYLAARIQFEADPLAFLPAEPVTTGQIR